jgi:hypothetical protein
MAKSIFYKTLIFKHIESKKVQNSKSDPEKSDACVPLSPENCYMYFGLSSEL